MVQTNPPSSPNFPFHSPHPDTELRGTGMRLPQPSPTPQPLRPAAEQTDSLC